MYVCVVCLCVCVRACVCSVCVCVRACACMRVHFNLLFHILFFPRVLLFIDEADALLRRRSTVSDL